MANNQGNGRNVAVPDENRPSWRPEDDNGPRNRRNPSDDDDDRYMSREDGRYGGHWEDRNVRWDRDEGRGTERYGTERYGQGQSGYGAGRYEDDRGFSSRNQAWRGDDRPWDRGTDERFSRGRGGSSWGERDEGRGRHMGGGGYGHGGYQESGGYLGQGGQQLGPADEDWGNEGYMGQRGQGRFRGNTSESQFGGGQRGMYGQRGMQGFEGQYGQGHGGSGTYGRDMNEGMYRGGRNQGMYGGHFGQGSSFGDQSRYGAAGEGGMYGHQQGGMYGHGPGSWGESEQNAPDPWRRDNQLGRGAYGQGSPGSQQSHRGKGPSGYTRSDERIKEMVCEALTEDHNIDATHIEVTVKNGEVVLSGTVEDRMQKRMAEDCLEQLSGIKDVQNQLRVVSDRRTSGKDSSAKETESQTGSPGQDKRHRA